MAKTINNNPGKIRVTKEDIESGNVELPEGYEFKKVKTREDRIRERIAEIEEELKGWKEPTTKELIAEGRMMHPYYMLNEELYWLREEVERWFVRG